MTLHVWGELSTEAIISLCHASAPTNPIYRHSLTRKLYLLIFIFLSLLLLLPAWALAYIPKSRRPRSSWSIERCLRVRWSRHLCGLIARCEIDYLGRDLAIDMDPLQLSHSHPLTIPPAPEDLLSGHPAEALAVIKTSDWIPHLIPPRSDWGRWSRTHAVNLGFAPVKAFWYTGLKSSPSDQPAEPNGPVMLHFHGGGYLCGTAAETDLTSSIPKALVQHSAMRHILSIDYRLAPNAPWPIPLLDAITAYNYLIGQGLEEIVLAGDSAGGHLALALTRWLQDEQTMPMPAALVLMSPWCDIGFSNSWGERAYKYNADSDTIDDTFGPFATSLLLRGLPPETMHLSAYLSPASLFLDEVAFDRFPPTFIVYGGAERLVQSTRVLADRLKLSRTANDAILEIPDAVHDFMIFPWQAHEAASVYEQLDAWLREVLSEAPQQSTLSSRRGRDSLKLERSPVMRPTRRESGVFDLLGDFHDESKSFVSIESISLSSATSAKEWLSPFAVQAEKGDWDWDGAWYDSE